MAANSATRVYGVANPVFGGSITGQQNGDTFSETFATTATPLSQVGAYPILPTATGASLSDYTVTTQNGTLAITQAGSATTLAASATKLLPGQSVTLTATAISQTSGVPTGSVQFYDGNTPLGSAILIGDTAALTISTLTPGVTYNLTATYGGDENFHQRDRHHGHSRSAGLHFCPKSDGKPDSRSGSQGTVFNLNTGTAAGQGRVPIQGSSQVLA